MKAAEFRVDLYVRMRRLAAILETEADNWEGTNPWESELPVAREIAANLVIDMSAKQWTRLWQRSALEALKHIEAILLRLGDDRSDTSRSLVAALSVAIRKTLQNVEACN